MKNNLACLLISLIAFFFVVNESSFARAAEETCECPKLGCDPCSINKGTTFYSGNCGPNNSRVKSCARPTCTPITDPTAECPRPPSASSGPSEPVVISGSPAVQQETATSAANAVLAGKVKVMSGSVSIVDSQGRKKVVTGEGEVHEGDKVETGADGAALVKLEGGNKVHVLPDTALDVQEHRAPEVEASRRTLLHLIKGKVRNEVNQKYKGDNAYYRVTTKAAVAGVRGTDFVVEHHEGDRLETKVETLKGTVELAKMESADRIAVGRGQGVTFSVDLKNAKKGEDWKTLVRNGKFSDVYQISDANLKELDKTTRAEYAKNKKPAKKDSAICTKPKALFDQCVWRHEGGNCVRMRCNANGQWADSTPAAGANCSAKGDLVKDCDY